MDKKRHFSLENSWSHRYPNREKELEAINFESKKEIDSHLISHSSRPFDFDSLELKNKKLSLIINNAIKDTSAYSTMFSDLKLNKQLNDNLELLLYQQMTPIQRLAIPHILKRSNIVGCAQTGSGKTLAYLLPIANLLLSSPVIPIGSAKYTSYPVVLIILPTRELAEQTNQEAIKIFYNTGIVSTVVYGGCPYPPQIKQLKLGVDILIATPGRLIDFLQRTLICLSHIKYIIFDEADRLLDMGFEREIDYIMKQIDIQNELERNTLMFSATFPKKVLDMVYTYLNNDFVTITIGNALEDNEDFNANVEQRFYYLNDNTIEAKIIAMHQLLQLIKGKTIIFVNMKRTADSLRVFLTGHNYSAMAIHGDKSQEERQLVIKSFADGTIPLLIATDVASRGLDIPNVDYVINFDFPTQIDDYIHRIGRTGRCGIKGRAFSYINNYDTPIFSSLVKLLKQNLQKIPDFLTNYTN